MGREGGGYCIVYVTCSEGERARGGGGCICIGKAGIEGTLCNALLSIQFTSASPYGSLAWYIHVYHIYLLKHDIFAANISLDTVIQRRLYV